MPMRRSANMLVLTRGPILAPCLPCCRTLVWSAVFSLCGSRAARDLLQAEIIVEVKILAVYHATIGRTAGRALHKFADQAVLDAEHHVAVEILVAGHEHMGHELLEAGRRDHEMHVRRAPGMAALDRQHVPNCAVMWDRIGSRLDRPEIEAAVRPGVEAPPPRKIADLFELLHVEIAIIV